MSVCILTSCICGIDNGNGSASDGTDPFNSCVSDGIVFVVKFNVIALQLLLSSPTVRGVVVINVAADAIVVVAKLVFVFVVCCGM